MAHKPEVLGLTGFVIKFFPSRACCSAEKRAAAMHKLGALKRYKNEVDMKQYSIMVLNDWRANKYAVSLMITREAFGESETLCYWHCSNRTHVVETIREVKAEYGEMEVFECNGNDAVGMWPVYPEDWE